MAKVITIVCDEGAHEFCKGYAAPSVYGSNRPCQCTCHDEDNPRDWARAAEAAMGSFTEKGRRDHGIA